MEEDVREKAIADLVRGTALVFHSEQVEDIRGLRISLVGVVEGPGTPSHAYHSFANIRRSD